MLGLFGDDEYAFLLFLFMRVSCIAHRTFFSF
jgi:hypothetical protein